MKLLFLSLLLANVLIFVWTRWFEAPPAPPPANRVAAPTLMLASELPPVASNSVADITEGAAADPLVAADAVDQNDMTTGPAGDGGPASEGATPGIDDPIGIADGTALVASSTGAALAVQIDLIGQSEFVKLDCVSDEASPTPTEWLCEQLFVRAPNMVVSEGNVVL